MIQLSKKIGGDLFLRETANQLFDSLEKMVEQKTIVLDFSNVRTMSRSFAHQYIIRKQKTNKMITEANQAPAVIQMFEYVTRAASKPVVIRFRTMEVEAL